MWLSSLANQRPICLLWQEGSDRTSNGYFRSEKFVMGRLSESQVRDEFYGQIRTLRISKGERYMDNFVPALSFEPDEQAVLIYQGEQSMAPRSLISAERQPWIWRLAKQIRKDNLPPVIAASLIGK